MKVTLPKIPVGLKTIVTDRSELKPAAEFERVIVRGIEAINVDAQKIKFDETALDRLTLINAAMNDAVIMDTEVRSCDTSAAAMTSGAFNRVRFTHCRMTGTDFSRAALKNVTFEDCKLDMANFRFAKLNTVLFEDCTFVESDFQLSELSNVIFKNCRIEKTNFVQCKIKTVDVRSSQLENIRGWRYLGGITLSHEQLIYVAPELAIDLGLNVEA